MTMLSTVETDVKYTRTGLVLSPSMSFDEWQNIGARLDEIDGAIKWWIGDWLNFGEQHYGEMYSQAVLVTGYDYQTLANQKWVSSRFELSRRRENLSFSHHAAVASLPPEKADALLDQAEGLSVRALRDKAFPQEPSPVCPTCGQAIKNKRLPVEVPDGQATTK